MSYPARRAGGDFMADALAGMSESLKDISGTPLWSAPDAQITELLAAAARVKNQLAALELRVLAEAHGRDLASRAGAASTQAWLRGLINVAPAEAKRQLALATTLSRDLPATRQALADGTVSVAHAQVIARAVEELPAEVDAATRQDAEGFLVEHAQQFDPMQVAKLGRRILDVVDPDAADADEARRLAAQERRAHQRRELSFTPDGHGTVWMRGRLDTESAAIVRRALDPLAKPRPTDVGEPDARSAGARTADALVEICRRVLADGDLPTQRGERPQLVVTIDFDKLARQVSAGALDTGEDLSPATVRRIACDARSSPRCSAATASRSISVGRCGCSRRHSAGR